MSSDPTVFVVSGNPSARRELSAWVHSQGHAVTACRGADEFGTLYRPRDAGCILLDASSGAADLELLRRRGPGHHLPVVVVALKADVDTAVAAMKLGASDYLSRASDRLSDALQEALAADAANRRQIAQAEGLRRRIATLSPGQKEVLGLIMAGHSNQEMADELGLSVRSIEVRRAKIMLTMRAKSLVDLVRRVLSLGMPR